MKQKVIKVGNSIGVTVPSSFVKGVGIKVGDSVDVRTKVVTGEIIYKFSGAQQLPLSSELKEKETA